MGHSWAREMCWFECPKAPVLEHSSDSQRVHLSQTLLKFPRRQSYPNFLLLKHKLSQKTSLSVRSEISVLFVNTLNADQMYSRHNWENFVQYLQRPITQKWKHFLELLFNFWTLHKIFWIFKKKIRFIA